MATRYPKSVEPVLEVARAFDEKVHKLYAQFLHLDRKSDRLLAASQQAISRSRQLLAVSRNGLSVEDFNGNGV